MMKSELEFMAHDRDIRNQIDEIRNMISDLMEAINDTVDDYQSLIKEGTNLGLEEDEIMEDYAGWVGNFEELGNFINKHDLNL